MWSSEKENSSVWETCWGGWNELKEAFLKEEEYFQSHFQEIDAARAIERGRGQTPVKIIREQ